ncbi:MAG: hypothetical protein AAB928_00130, partial [Patescibacteria group bacterium]
MHDLEMAMDRAGGYNAALVKHMCTGDHLVHIREYLLKQAEITYPERRWREEDGVIYFSVTSDGTTGED